MNWFRRFMQGRYGTDELSLAFVALFVLLNIVSLFAKSFIISLLYILLFVFFTFRILSRNIAARQRENYKFLKLWRPIATYFRRLSSKMRNRKYYKYFKCPDCKRQMRVPKGKGTIIVTCPGCSKKIKRKS